MRFVGSLIKFLVYTSLITIAAGAALFWFDTGSWLVRPLAERAGSFFLYPAKIEVESVEGSLRNGYTLDGLRVISGDETLALLRHASVSPDWDLALSGMDGIPFVRSLNVHGVSTDLDSVMKIASLFPASPEDKPQPITPPMNLRLNPSHISVSDVHFGTQFANLELSALTLDEAGKFLLDAQIVSSGKTLPLSAKASINLPSAEIISSDIRIGAKGTGKFTGKIQPLDAKLFLSALQLDDFMQFAPAGVKATGRADAKISAKANDDDGSIAASGVLSMPRAEVMDIPLNFRLPFTWDGRRNFTLDDASLTTKAAGFTLSASGDIEAMRFTAKGEGKNISLTEIGAMLAPEAGLKGEGGYVKFDADTQITSDIMQDIFQRTRASLKADIPSVSAMGINTAENITANVSLTPGHVPQISLGGKAFGGKLFARGGAVTDQEGNVKPDGVVVSVVNLDIPSLVRAVPQLSGVVEKPQGKITARVKVSEALRVTAKLTSDLLGAYGVTLTGLDAEAEYDPSANRAELSGFTANFGRGRITASGNADLDSGTFSAKADANNIEPRNAPMLRDVSGSYSLKAAASGNFTDIKSIVAEALLTARNAGLSSAGIKGGNAEIPVSLAGGVVKIPDASVRFPGSSAALKAEADIVTGRFSANADARNLDLRFIPQLKGIKGAYSLRAEASGSFNDTKAIKADALLTAQNAGYTGINIGNAEIPVTFRDNILTIRSAKATFPSGSANLNATANLGDSTFRADADVRNLELKFIPGLQDISGKYSLKADASGRFTDINAITANASLSARNTGFQAMRFGDADIPVSFKGGILSINGAKASLPGGNLNAKGTVNLRSMNNPVLDITASTPGLNLAQLMTALKLQDKSMPVSGRVKGSAAIKGSLSTAAISANLNADSVKAGNAASIGSASITARGNMTLSQLAAKLTAKNIKAAGFVDVPGVSIEADGNMKQVNIRKVSATVNGAEIIGSGNILPNMKDIMASAVNIQANVKHLDLKKLLKNFMQKAPVEGVIDAKASVTGPLYQPTASLKLTKPVLYQKSEIHDIALSVSSPSPNHFVMKAGARINNFKPESDIDIQMKPDGIYYTVDTKPLDIDSAIETQLPDMAGIVKGHVIAHVHGNTKLGSPIVVNAKSDGITILDKIRITDINLPVKYLADKGRVQMTNGKAVISGGTVRTSFEADMKDGKTEWHGDVKASHIDFGKLAQPFMPEGELVGTVDAAVSMKGSSAVGMNLSFADGKFSTSKGCLQKVKALETITPTGKITFEKISGSFFWDGKDLFLNPGTGARAGFDEPLYRYFTINGACGLPGKGMRLLCDGRFDLKILDQLLGAMKGVFQYMTGSLARNVLRDAASRVMGIKRRDFQNVSFTLANSPFEPQLRDLKVTKPIEDFLPIDILNGEEEKQKDSVQFKMSIKVPVGKGAPSAEDESPGDQFKQQLIDNLFNIGM
ncbi:MAG: hypothetical protein IJP86_03230 [Synergistaceae bacterium]|nr:hypothetical protein [Synergistaceae bacterium]